MLEVVFSSSAGGSLKVAQHCGKGKYHGSIGIVFGSTEGGEKPAEAELEAMRKRGEEQARQKWERAVPMGGDPSDVYPIDLVLSVGDISEDTPGPRRRAALELLFGTWGREDERHLRKHLEKVEETWAAFRERAAAGEPIRAWYSDNPDELCGLHWLMARLEELPHGEIDVVKLPDWEPREDGTATRCLSWGEMSPGEWHRYLAYQRRMPRSLCVSYALRWRELQKENAPLRAVLNGRLVSAPESLYDSFIEQEIAAAPAEFREAVLIGGIMGKYQLGIGDGWIALRIEKLVRSGALEVVSEAREDRPTYDRVLRKI